MNRIEDFPIFDPLRKTERQILKKSVVQADQHSVKLCIYSHVDQVFIDLSYVNHNGPDISLERSTR